MSEAPDGVAMLLELAGDNSKLLRSLEASVAKFDKASNDVEARGKRFAKHTEEAFAAPNIGKALERTFASARLGVLEEGSARLRLFGSALEPLGGFGLAAAAGVAGFALAMERTEKAVEYAANIAKLGKEVGVSTDFIQEFNFAAKQSEIDVGVADKALQGLNATLGQINSGLAKKRTVDAFEAATGLSKAKLADYRTIDQLFPVMAEHIKQLYEASNHGPAEVEGVLKRAGEGAEALIPLLIQGKDGFNSLTKAARDLGVVMDETTIRKAEEAKVKLNELDQVMKAKAMITFAQFADTLLKVKGLLLDIETGFLKVIAAITNTQPIGDKLEHLQKQRDQLAASNAAHGVNDPTRLAALDKEIAALKKLQAGSGEPSKPPAGPVSALVDGTAKHGPADTTLSFDKSANDAYDGGLKALIQAQAALTGDIQARADLEKQAIDADLTKKLNDLDVEEQKIRAAKNDRHKAEQLALIDKTKTEEQNAAAARKELIDRQAAFALEDRVIEIYKAGVDAQLAALQSQASMATTAKERAALELKILALRQQEERDLHETQIDRRTHTAANPGGDLSPDQAAALKDDFRATQDAEAAAAKQQAYLSANPFSAYERSLQDLNTTMQQDGVEAAKELSHALTDAALGAKGAGQEILNVFRNLFAKLLEQSIERDVAAPFFHLLGFADGGRVRGPGSSTSDSIPSMLSNDEFVVKASAAQKHAALLEAINNDRMPHFAQGGWVAPSFPALTALSNLSIPQVAGGMVVVQPLHFHAEGAVLTSEILAQANAHANRAAAQAAQVARTAAGRDVQRADYARNLNA